MHLGAFRTQIIGASLGISLLAGCASSGFDKVTASAELPKELQEKFEVMDASSLDPPPVPVASSPAEPVGKGKKLGKRGKGAAAPAAAPAPVATPGIVVYPSRRPAKDPVWIGEKMIFDITYFGMSAGDFTLEALPLKAIGSRRVYHMKGTAISSKVFNLFYRLNDTVESFIDYEGMFSHRFHIVLDETKQSRDSLELNDSEKGQTFYWNRWNHKERGYSESKEYSPMQPFSQDSISALYFLRTQPLKTGDVVTVPIVSEGKVWEAVVTVMRREMMETPMGKVQTIVLKPETKYQGVLQKRGDSFLWLTDDERRFIVRLEAKVRIGTVVANLKKMEPGSPP